jgi:hypothetical protein
MTRTKIQQGIHDYMIAGLTPMHLASVERGERLFMTKTKQVIKDWLHALEAPRRGLTDWEHDFVDNVTEQMRERGGISDRQEEILERILAEKT